MTAVVKLGLSPNIMDVQKVLNKPTTTHPFLPYRSANLPNEYELKNRPTLNAAATTPAR